MKKLLPLSVHGVLALWKQLIGQRITINKLTGEHWMIRGFCKLVDATSLRDLAFEKQSSNADCGDFMSSTGCRSVWDNSSSFTYVN